MGKVSKTLLGQSIKLIMSNYLKKLFKRKRCKTVHSETVRFPVLVNIAIKLCHRNLPSYPATKPVCANGYNTVRDFLIRP